MAGRRAECALLPVNPRRQLNASDGAIGRRDVRRAWHERFISV